MPANRILVDLDAFLDANAALCRSIDPVAFSNWVINDKYRERYSNEFWKRTDKCSKEEFLKRWEKRDKELLKQSIHTNVHLLIAGLISSIDWGPHTGDPTNCIEITINLAPYDFNDEERASLVSILETALPMVKTFRMVSWPLWALHPTQIRDHFDLVVMSNFIAWFRLYAERMDEFELGNIDVVAPRLFTEMPDEGTDDWKALAEEDIFTFLGGRLVGRCMLTFESPYWFSLVDPGQPVPEPTPKQAEPVTAPSMTMEESELWLQQNPDIDIF